MALLIAAISSAILVLGGGFHLYWAFGGRVGAAISVPERLDGVPAFNPGPAATLSVALFLFAVLPVVLALTGVAVLPIPRFWLRVAAALLAGLFLARALSWHKYVGLLKNIRHTRFAWYDTWLYSPLCLLLAVSLIGAVLLPS
jgi:hypothetical protein